MFTEDVVKGSLFCLSFSFNLSCWSEMKEGKTLFFWPSYCRLFVVLPLEGSMCYSLLYTCDVS